MRTSERLMALKKWVYKNLCEGRSMKAPSPDLDISDICYQEPKVYLGWQPTRPDQTGMLETDPLSVTPGILIMPAQSYGKYVEEKRFDRYNNIHRAQEMGQQLAISMLFSVYEPGVRLPGFVESVQNNQANMSLLMEGTEQGLFCLTNWMDDCVSGLLAAQSIPHSDLFLQEATLQYGLFTDQSYVVDKRPLYYGFVNFKFGCYADDKNNKAINDYLI